MRLLLTSVPGLGHLGPRERSDADLAHVELGVLFALLHAPARTLRTSVLPGYRGAQPAAVSARWMSGSSEVSSSARPRTARPASSRATGTRNGEQET